MSQFLRHLFVCVNDRGPGGKRASCAHREGKEVADLLKKTAFQRGLKRIVRVNKAGCLDQCERGATLVCYPEGIWYGGVKPADVEEIVERTLMHGETIERLVIPDDCLTGKPVPDGLDVTPTARAQRELDG